MRATVILLLVTLLCYQGRSHDRTNTYLLYYLIFIFVVFTNCFNFKEHFQYTLYLQRMTTSDPTDSAIPVRILNKCYMYL